MLTYRELHHVNRCPRGFRERDTIWLWALFWRPTSCGSWSGSPVMASPSGGHYWQICPCPMCWYYRQLTITILSSLPGEVWYWFPTGTILRWLREPSFVPTVSWQVSSAFIESGAGIIMAHLSTYIHQRGKCDWTLGVAFLEVLPKAADA